MVYHISHIDLDGYGCQIITEKHYGKKNIKFYNCNYGKAIKYILHNILKVINKEDTLIITDINIDETTAKYINKEFYLKEIETILIDHHITGKNVAIKYDWYNLNITYCATKLTQLYFKKDNLELFADYVNAQDLWYTDNEYFPKANYLSDIAFKGYDFPSVISEENFKYRTFTIKKVFNKVKKGWSIRKIQKNFINIQEEYLAKGISQKILKNKNIPVEHKFVRYIFEKIKEKDFPILTIGNSTGKIFFDLGSNIFQQMSHMYNNKIKDMDFVVHVNKRGKLSFRSNGDKIENNVELLSKIYFNGGGHFNAAGGSLFDDPDKKIVSENEAITIIKNIIKNVNKLNFKEIKPKSEYLEKLLDNKPGKLLRFNDVIYILRSNKNIYSLSNNKDNKILTINNANTSTELSILECFKEMLVKN